jgi:hypothetical protein
MCGGPVEQITNVALRVEGDLCVDCNCVNEVSAHFCRSCGAELINKEKAALRRVPAVAAVGAMGAFHRDMSGEEAIIIMEDLSPSSGADVGVADPRPERANNMTQDKVTTRHESFIAKLDRMEQELEARQEISAEPDPALEYDDRQEKLDSLSTTLDALIADLLEVEINEYSFPDFIHPDESGFPSKDPASYVEKPAPPPKKRSPHEILLIVALIIAIFMVGLSFGLWGAYFLGIFGI